MCTAAILNEITSKVVQAAKDSLGDKLHKVILYGSHARGDQKDDDTIDILVLANITMEEALREYEKIRDRILGIGSEYDVLLSIRITPQTRFCEYRDVLPFYQNIQKDGVVLCA